MALNGIRVGVGGWTFAPWRGGAFYPDGLAQARELRFMASKLTSVEISGTFYGSQKPESFQRWHDDVPDDFVFALKGPRFATNRRVLAEAGDSISRFVESGVTRLGRKLGPINWQFAGTKKFDPGDFEAFLAMLPKEADGLRLRHAVEVRHPSFAVPEFAVLLRRYGVAPVIAQHETYPQIADLTAPFVYVRLQTASGPAGYSDTAIDHWASTCKSWAAGEAPGGLTYAGVPADGAGGPRAVFVYFIGGAKDTNPASAARLIARLSTV